ncbi:hypothetical protein TIFTF001_026920 [Ficus carica]|uniref:Uncharacterized protein n=1 Tax=Ficus carica TaxID=3494 RepID=A0AA88DM17_FICCA|nr:hypothetical protein TIFTF001_026920 [Ficus carica]
MASLGTSEKWAFINTNDFLTSLMEELQDHVDEGDEDRLNCVIQSLEAEINSSTTDVSNDACIEPNDHQSIYNGEDSQSSGLGHMDDRDCSVLLGDFDLNGWNIDDNMEAVPCSPSHDMMNWDMYRFGDEISDSFIGFEGISSSDNSFNACYGVALDDNSLWQEYDSVMYH